jgi:ribosomal protein S18 acetylase RimI-like enzyme
MRARIRTGRVTFEPQAAGDAVPGLRPRSHGLGGVVTTTGVGRSDRQLRHPAEGDLPAIQRLVDACERGETGESRESELQVAASFALPLAAPEHNWWVATEGHDCLGFARLWTPSEHEVVSEVFIAAACADDEICGRLYLAAEERAREIVAGSAWTPSHFTLCPDALAARQDWLIARGYRRVRDLCVMRIDGSAPLETPAWPFGIVARSARPGVDDEVLWKADVEAYSEHYLYDVAAFDAWHADVFERPSFEPAFYVVAWAGEEVAGQALAVTGEDPGMATLQDVSVRKPRRGRGVGRALLLELLARLRARGRGDVTVWVDAENETGAKQLYESAGMREWRRLGVFELDLGGN